MGATGEPRPEIGRQGADVRARGTVDLKREVRSAIVQARDPVHPDPARCALHLEALAGEAVEGYAPALHGAEHRRGLEDLPFEAGQRLLHLVQPGSGPGWWHR